MGAFVRGIAPLAPAFDFAHNKPRDKKDRCEMTIKAPETRIVDRRKIACDGGEGALGHPRVWLQIPQEQGWVECPYCDCKFVYAQE